MRNKKILAGLLLATITATWLSYSFADDTTSSSTWSTITRWQRPELTDEQKAQMEAIRTIMEKQKNWETLTTQETATLEEFKSNMPEGGMWGKNWEKWWMWGNKGEMNNLTDEEKTALESMTDEEKQVFYETKREEAKAQREAQETVIDKLLSWETLTADEETVRQELITQRAEQKTKRAEMETQREQIEAIKEKQTAWETLTDEETSLLEELWNHEMWGHWMMR